MVDMGTVVILYSDINFNELNYLIPVVSNLIFWIRSKGGALHRWDAVRLVLGKYGLRELDC